MSVVPPPPIKNELGTYVWQEWFRQIRDRTNASLTSVTWSSIDFAGSNISDIVSRDHNVLTSIQGGTTGEYYHLTSTQLSGLTSGSSTSLHSHSVSHNSTTGLQGGTSAQYYHLTANEYSGATQSNIDASKLLGNTWASPESIGGTTPATGKFTTLTATQNLVLPKTSGYGIQVDVDSPTFGWKDLIGDVTPKASGAGSPTLTTFRSDIRWFNYAVGDEGDIVFHIPHDYLPGSDLYIHFHWGHNGTNISGSIDLRLHLSYAKGHQQEDFPADTEMHIVVNSLNITNTPQYRHRVDEIQASSSGGSVTTIDTDLIEPDGMILVHYDVDTIPTITGGSGKPFIFGLDLHYQSTNMTTKNKSPNFYT